MPRPVSLPLGSRIKQFVVHYRVTLVTITGMAGLHYIWLQMQNNNRFVRPDERMGKEDWPFIRLLRKLKTKYIDDTSVPITASTKAEK